jgi:cytochrome c oxidase cbb3-type subunit 1
MSAPKRPHFQWTLTRWPLPLYVLLLLLTPVVADAQTKPESVFSQPAVVGTGLLLLLIIGTAVVVVFLQLRPILNRLYPPMLPDQIPEADLEEHPTGEQFDELRTALVPPRDKRGLVQRVSRNVHAPLVSDKKRGQPLTDVDPKLVQLVSAYLLCATVWLVFGTLVGWYVGIKFVRPDIDHIAWLSFGRLRPVHTNAVFWGWTSLAMLGLGNFVVPRTGSTPLYSYRIGWWTLWLINAATVLGTLCLMAGINNGGGEYREYIWPVMLLFAVGLILTFYNYFQTIANRKTPEIYISNWYIVGACGWVIILSVIAYLPFYQNGLGETIIQGYYMHQGVGMWFMTFTLGLVYYFLPLSLNKPIYSYSLGALAFWTQLLFYTLIGTHHYVFSPIAWWLQTVAIVFSAGMFIPVLAGTINFAMTFRGSSKQVGDSYSLPFLLIGVVLYFTGSVQGSLQAFRTTNLVWHFTDFNVAHSHITMYGIVAFMLWGCIYTLLPKLTGREPRTLLVGIHFWFALIGLMAYVVALMVGGTFKGLSWMAAQPFIDSVVLMAPYWLWRAIGGTLMLLAHFVFGYNLLDMLRPPRRQPAPTLQPLERHEYSA